jgi:hypothetical protein
MLNALFQIGTFDNHQGVYVLFFVEISTIFCHGDLIIQLTKRLALKMNVYSFDRGFRVEELKERSQRLLHIGNLARNSDGTMGFRGSSLIIFSVLEPPLIVNRCSTVNSVS